MMDSTQCIAYECMLCVSFTRWFTSSTLHWWIKSSQDKIHTKKNRNVTPLQRSHAAERKKSSIYDFFRNPRKDNDFFPCDELMELNYYVETRELNEENNKFCALNFLWKKCSKCENQGSVNEKKTPKILIAKPIFLSWIVCLTARCNSKCFMKISSLVTNSA